MANSSAEPESDADTQCIYCGRWFHGHGVLQHEEVCGFKDGPGRNVELIDEWARHRAPDIDVDNVEEDKVVDLETEDRADHTGDRHDRADDVDENSFEAGLNDVDETVDQLAAPRTDGGEAAEPPSFDDVASDGGSIPEDDVPTCPSCDSPEYIAVANLPDTILDAAPELENHDRLCAPCSLEDGSLRVENGALQVEAYDVDGGRA